jgi:pSer/pThr/pTyr-binding forkhead associated (FHA) protein
MADGKKTPEPTRLESVENLRQPQPGTVLETPPAAHPATRQESAADIRKALSEKHPPTAIESSPVREATRLESADEVRQASASSRTAAPATVPFRPARRPPVANLTICDDGKSEGEVVRLRSDRTVIGRSEGDIRIPHDAMMSSRHAEIVREGEPSGWRWALVNLQSTNGSYVRVVNVPLKHGTEVLIGSAVLRFEDAILNLPGAVPEGTGTMPTKTQGWQTLKPTDLKASLVLVQPDGLGKRFFLEAPEQWLGRDAVPISLSEDVLVDPRHARVVRDAKGVWSIIDADSRNGVWLRIDRHVLEGTCAFQLGEQRFVFQVNGAV